MKKNLVIIFVFVLAMTSACSSSGQSFPAATTTATVAPAAATFTPIPTYTPVPSITPIPGTVVLDFTVQVCNAKWMNGGQKFSSCPDANADHSAGYAAVLDPASEGLPAGTPVLLTIPAWNGFQGLFLRYPALKIEAGDRFRATLQCQSSAANCDVNFGLDYYDADGKYHSSLAAWDQNSGMTPTTVDHDLSALAGQIVDLVLVLRPNNNTPQQDVALWIVPQVFRPAK